MIKEMFLDDNHKQQFFSLMGQDGTSASDRERMAMFLIISGNPELFSNRFKIYDFHYRRLRSVSISRFEALCSSSVSLLMLAINLYNGHEYRHADPVNLLRSLDHDNLTLALNAMHVRFA